MAETRTGTTRVIPGRTQILTPTSANQPRVIPGRTQITAKALTGSAVGVAADVLGVSPRQVRAAIDDVDGALSVSVTAPVAFAGLGTARAAGAETLLKRAERHRREIGDRLSAAVSRSVGRVELHHGSATIRQERRVR